MLSAGRQTVSLASRHEQEKGKGREVLSGIFAAKDSPLHCAPPSFWPAPQLDYRLPSNLVVTIDETLTTRLPHRISKLERHNILQQRLHSLGADLGFTSRIEVSTGYRRCEATGRFDVVWDPYETGAPPGIFEIDSCWRHESLLTLGRDGEEGR